MAGLVVRPHLVFPGCGLDSRSPLLATRADELQSPVAVADALHGPSFPLPPSPLFYPIFPHGSDCALLRCVSAAFRRNAAQPPQGVPCPSPIPSPAALTVMDSFPSPVLAAAADVAKLVDGDDSLPVLWTSLYFSVPKLLHRSHAPLHQYSRNAKSLSRTAVDSRIYLGASGISQWSLPTFPPLVTFWKLLWIHAPLFHTKSRIVHLPPTSCPVVLSPQIPHQTSRCLRMVRPFFNRIGCFQRFLPHIFQVILCIDQFFPSDLRYGQSFAHPAS